MSWNPSSANQRFSSSIEWCDWYWGAYQSKLSQTRKVQSGWFEKLASLLRVCFKRGIPPSAPKPGAEGLEHASGHSGRDGAEAGVQPLLRGCVAAVEPDRQTPSGFDLSGDLPKSAARIGSMVQHADRIDQVESPFGQWQVEQVGLDDRDVGKMGAQRGGLDDGRAQIDADQLGAVGTNQPGIATAAAARVEHQLTRQVARRYPGLDRKRRLILLGPHHVVAVPLPAEAGGVRISGQPGYAVNNRHDRRTIPASEFMGRVADDIETSAAARTSDQRKQFLAHVQFWSCFSLSSSLVR